MEEKIRKRAPGGGRKPMAENGELKKMRSTRATEEEWELIKVFERYVKQDIKGARKIVTRLRAKIQ